jgi:hypothetical protein
MPAISTRALVRRTRLSSTRVRIWTEMMSNAPIMTRGTLIGGFSRRRMTVWTESACIVE